MKKNGAVMSVAILLLLLVILQNDKTFDQVQAKMELSYEQTVPSLDLKGLDGKNYKLGGQREKPLMINFWASWCPPCREEIPALNKVYNQYKDKFDLYAVNVTKTDNLDKVKQFVNQHDLKFPVLLDLDGEAASAYRILFLPTSFLVDKNGNVREAIHVLSAEELEKRIQSLIAS